MHIATPVPQFSVLVVEGNPVAEADLVRVLEFRGCRVVLASSAQDVIRHLVSHREPIRVAVIDTAILGRDHALMAEIRQRNPGVSLLFIHPGVDDVPLAAGDVSLSQPISSHDIATVIFELARGSMPELQLIG